MRELIKPWNDGGSLSVAYEGDGDGSAVFSSDAYEGIDRTQIVTFKGGGLAIERTVRQEGTRQPFRLAGGGIFRVANGGRFGVLKEGGVVPPTPPTPVETYTRLTYIECTGAQYINTGYVVQEDDIIEMDYIGTKKNSADKFLFAATNGTSVWVSLYSNSGYVRFGSSSSTTVSNGYAKYRIKLQKNKVTFGNTETSISTEAMPDAPLHLFANRNDNGAYGMCYCRCTRFTISNAEGVVMDLRPYKRDSDGTIGLLDIISGAFYSSEGESLVAGNEMRLPDGYDRLSYISFNADRIFDAGLIESTYTIECLWARNTASGSQYMYGIVTSPHTATVTAYCTSSGTWRWGNQGSSMNFANTDDHFTKQYNANIYYDGSTRAYTKSPAFTTPDTLIVGGRRGSDGVALATYIGKIYHFSIYESGAVLLDWYPCKRLSDGMEGFWDCVTQTFIEPL